MTAKNFSVSHRGIKLKIKLLPTIDDVHMAYQSRPHKMPTSVGMVVHAYFEPAATEAAQAAGTICLPMAGGNLYELIPHEVVHAVMHKVRVCCACDDEGFATAIGMLTERIFARLTRMEVVCPT